ncbi:MAG: electron transfer flavoprotein subunit alpha/FixB family protein [Deltaproteobacteria bacterium]|nr:electron transfer flavoprotein subunit alpha/FixB family protein [Deltaproteobacteria bacterium]
MTGDAKAPARRGAIWIVAEQAGERLAPVSLEILGQALRMARAAGGCEVDAVLIGNDAAGPASALAAAGAEKVFLADDPRLSPYQNDTHGAVLTRLIAREGPDVVLFGASACGEELAPTVAARLDTGLGAHCTDLDVGTDGLLMMGVLGFGGRVHTEMFCPAKRPQMASVKPGMFQPPPRAEREGTVVREDVAGLLAGAKIRLRAVAAVRVEPEGGPLEGAEVVVAGGFGIGGKEPWALLEELARELSGAVGCTRPALDEGWTSGEHTMIGTSGRTVRPKVYLGFGISGSPHHTVGIKDAGIIVSVNSDPHAPVFDSSDYCVVSDFRKIVPALVREIRKVKGGGSAAPSPASA